eukprot:TRINITY_DN2719_c2_g3_i3.p1 TRINITY_DN2719_c2_g3~~TRINITY_DN2719_c2_g3_i3.p1  ORF type:complete len:765 (+),score=108.40 TRINITY_DN2719_c2_g3_i3:436-2730(+)
MEYASGGELFDYIVQSHRVPEPEACRFFHQIIAGVEKIHAMNVVHRDLKPENLLLDEHKCIKIVDFGLSNRFRDNQKLKTACGSPCYAPPEMVAGHSYVPQPCDLWSCGVILFAMVCGYLPFEDDNTSALYKKILAANYTAPDFISSRAKNLIAGLLTIDPTQRLNIAGVRKHPWYQQIPDAGLRPRDLLPGQLGLDEDVLLELKRHGFPREYAVNCLQQNKHNNVTTTYYLLAAKRKRMVEQLQPQLRPFDEDVRRSPSPRPASPRNEVEVPSQAPAGPDTTPSSGSRVPKAPTSTGVTIPPGASAMDPRPASPVLDHTTFTPPRLHTPRPVVGAGASPPRRDASNSEAQSPAAPTPVPLRDLPADPLLYSGGDSRGSGVRGSRTTGGSSGAVGQQGSGNIHASGISSSVSNSLGGSVKGGGTGSPAAPAGGNGSQALATPGNTPRTKGYPIVSWTASSASAREPPGPPPSPGPQVPQVGCNASTPQRSPEQRSAPLSAREVGGHGSIIAALWSRGTPADRGNGSGQLCGTPQQSPPPSARDVPRKGPDVSLPGTPKGPAPQAVGAACSNSTPLRRPLLQQHQRHANSGTSQAESVERRPSGASTSHSMPGNAEARDSSRSADSSRRRAGYPQQVAQQSTPAAASTPQQQHQHQQSLPQSPRPEARYVIRQPLTLGSVPRTGISTTPLSARARTGPASQTIGQTSIAPQGSLSAREQTSRGGAHPASATGATSSAAARTAQSTQSPMARMAYPTAWAFGGRMR